MIDTMATNPERTEAMLAVARRWALPGALAGIVVLAAAVRMIGISENPPGFFTDEASIGYNAYTLLNSGTGEHGEGWPVLFKSLGDFKLPVIIYSTVPFVATLGLTELAVRLAAATYGTLTVLTTFLLASALFRDRRVGVAAALFLAVMPWHIHYSRTGFGELVSFLPFLTLGLYLFLLGVRRNQLWPVSGVVLSLTLHTYRAAWVVLPPLLLLLAVLYHKELLKGWRMSASAAGIFLLISLPILLHLMSDSGDRSQDAGLLKLDLSAWETAKTFVTQYRSHFSTGYLFEHGDNWAITRHYLPGFGQLYLIQLPLIILGLLGILFSLNREKTIVLALLALYPLAGALSDTSPISSRTILGTVVFAMLTAYGLVLLVRGLSKLNRPYGRVAVTAVLVFVGTLSLSAFASYLDRYHGEYQQLSAGYWGWQSGPQEIIEYFMTVEGQYDQLIMDGEFNAPHEFFNFYAPEMCGKCTIGNTLMYDPSKRQLFALKPKHLPGRYAYRTVHEVRYPGGELAFSLTEITGRP